MTTAIESPSLAQPLGSGADITPRPGVSIIVPTFRENANITPLVQGIEEAIKGVRGGAEMVIVDDNSRDGTEETVARLGKNWVRLIIRREERGLASAVLEGFRQARGDILLVMDADLSHPPSAIPALVEAIRNGADMSIGSRYVPGGSIDGDWSFMRRLNSSAATLLARPLTNAKDPMSGFFALHRDTFARGRDLRAMGYKIGLEVLVKCGCSDVREVPIRFSDRRAGESKLSLRIQLEYVRQVVRLALCKITGQVGEKKADAKR